MRHEVEAVNTAFYEAFETADLDTMQDLWLDDPETLCVHPGALPVRGTGPISRSWALIMANTPYIQFFLTDVEVSLRGEPADVASVTCTENVLHRRREHRDGLLRWRQGGRHERVRAHTRRLADVDPPRVPGTLGRGR